MHNSLGLGFDNSSLPLFLIANTKVSEVLTPSTHQPKEREEASHPKLQAAFWLIPRFSRSTPPNAVWPSSHVTTRKQGSDFDTPIIYSFIFSSSYFLHNYA